MVLWVCERVKDILRILFEISKKSTIEFYEILFAYCDQLFHLYVIACVIRSNLKCPKPTLTFY